VKRPAIAFLLVCALTAPAAVSQPPAALTAIYEAGETLDLDLSWLGLSGGSMRMTIGPLPGDATKLRITSVARSSSSFSFLFKVDDEIQSIVDRRDFSSIRYDKHLNERGKVKDDTTFVDEQHGIATRHRPKKIDERIAVPKPVFDPLSLVYHLRSLELEPGRTQRFPVVADGKLYTLEAKITGRETLTTGAGTFRTVVVQPNMAAGGLFKGSGTLTIWYSDDVRHLPVRIRSDLKVGSITATLQAIHSGADTPEPK
jgi:hypothetical protein